MRLSAVCMLLLCGCATEPGQPPHVEERVGDTTIHTYTRTDANGQTLTCTTVEFPDGNSRTSCE